MFKQIEVTIEGTQALLMHRFGELAEASVPGGSGKKGQVRSNTAGATATPREVAESVAYREPSGNLFFPAAGIARLLREQGSTMKAKGSRKSLKYIVPAAVHMMTDTLPLFALDRTTRLKDFEVDSRPVVIPATRGRIMRHRPKLFEWTAKFQIRLNQDLLTEATVRELLEMGGMCIGLGDFRPEKGGPFGTFSTVEWK